MTGQVSRKETHNTRNDKTTNKTTKDSLLNLRSWPQQLAHKAIKGILKIIVFY